MTVAATELDKLLIYRNLLSDELVKQMRSLPANGENAYELAGKLIQFAEETGIEGNLPLNYLIYQIGYGQNLFSSTAEKDGENVGKDLLKAVAHDVAILKRVLKTGVHFAAVAPFIAEYQPTHPQPTSRFAALQDYFLDNTAVFSPEQVAELLCQMYVRYGYGDMATCTAFRWDSNQGLVGVKHSDPVRLEDIVGYERQKQTLIDNTAAFVDGKPANNVLLVGARGTGKSTSVKALANHYYEQGLRLVEVTKRDLEFLPAIMNALRSWGKKFIVFLDDLSFEEYEVSYKNLKSVMDGGLETQPDNVLIYATSNRRHLVKESWNDREGEELHRQDSVNEKISLSDRFGITITYFSPSQEEYLNIVENIAKKNHIIMEREELRSLALRWEMGHSGRSGRLARQFIASLAGKTAKKTQ